MHIRSVFGGLVLAAFCCLTAIAFGQDKLSYSETKAIFAGNTAVSYDRGHGTQVEFISTNGRTYLFYPNNTVIVKGEWKLERTDQPDVFSMCFRYPTNSLNPVTGQAGGDWECQIAGFYFAGLEELVQGDPLGLSRRSEVPFVLSPAKTTFAQLVRKLAQ